jgi:hypothetical protein
MFFPRNRLDDFLTPAQAREAINIFNQWIQETGQPVFGNMDNDGKAHDFTSSKKSDDFYVGFLIGIELMGEKAPLKSGHKTTPTSDIENRLQAIVDKNRQLEKQLEQIR